MKESFELIHHKFPIDSCTIQITIGCYVRITFTRCSYQVRFANLQCLFVSFVLETFLSFASCPVATKSSANFDYAVAGDSNRQRSRKAWKLDDDGDGRRECERRR